MLEEAYDALDHLERFLQGSEFLVGNSLTLADLAVSPTIQNLRIWLTLDATKYGRILAWFDRVEKSFPGFKEMSEPHLEGFAKDHAAKFASIKKQVE